ncbi:MAG: FtsX-like permease family protein, partial [Cocleimonas sp.]
PILKDFTIIDTFKVDMQVYDSGYAYVHLQDAIDLFETKGVVTGLHAQLDDAFKAIEASNGIAGVLKENYAITNWKTKNTNLFKVIQLQKTMLFLVVILIIGVAAFNLVSTLIMMVTEKQSDIAILRTMGMSPAQVMRIFIVQGSLLGMLGTLLGVFLGVIVASNITDIVNWFEQILNVNLLKAEVHQLTEIDAEINYTDILLISFIAISLSILATLFPAWQASKVPPAEALRYD